MLGNNKQLLGKLKKQLMNRFEMTDLGNVSKVLGINVTWDRENGTSTIDQKDDTEDYLERYGMTNCNVEFTSGVGPEISLDQPVHRLLDEQGKQRYQSIAGVLMYLAQVSRYDILYAVISWRGQCQALESLHGSCQTRNSVLGWVREFPDNLQARRL